ITSSSGLSKEEVERMAKDAEAHAAEDKDKREEIEARNQLDGMVYNIEKMLKDAGDKVQAADKTDVEAALAEAKKTLESSPSAKDMRAAYDKLTASSHKLAEAMYKASSAQGAPGAGEPTAQADGSGASSQKKEGEVIDAEYVDVDDKK